MGKTPQEEGVAGIPRRNAVQECQRGKMGKNYWKEKVKKGKGRKPLGTKGKDEIKNNL